MIDYKYGVHLLPVNSSDAPLLQKWRNDPRIWHWCRQNDLISDSMQSRWIASQDQNPTIHMYMVATASNGKVGVTGFTSHDHINRTAELSLYIAPDYHKKGLSEPTFRTLMQHGFKNLGLNTIYCECFDKNPVIKVVKKVGFKSWGTKRECYFRDGKFINTEHFLITSKEWAG